MPAVTNRPPTDLRNIVILTAHQRPSVPNDLLRFPNKILYAIPIAYCILLDLIIQLTSEEQYKLRTSQL
jgi:hypothetical protein